MFPECSVQCVQRCPGYSKWCRQCHWSASILLQRYSGCTKLHRLPVSFYITGSCSSGIQLAFHWFSKCWFYSNNFTVLTLKLLKFSLFQSFCLVWCGCQTFHRSVNLTFELSSHRVMLMLPWKWCNQSLPIFRMGICLGNFGFTWNLKACDHIKYIYLGRMGHCFCTCHTVFFNNTSSLDSLPQSKLWCHQDNNYALFWYLRIYVLHVFMKGICYFSCV